MRESKITVLNEEGKELEADVLLYFSMAKCDKNYILYTFHEVDDQSMETIHASVLLSDGDEYKLEKISDEEWLEVKNVMREVIKNEEE